MNNLVQFTVIERILTGVLHEDILGVEVDYFHVFSCHCASLAQAQICDKTNSFNRLDVTDENVVVLTHLKDTVGDRDRHGHWQALGDSDNKHDQGNDNILCQLLDEVITS